MSGQGIPRCLTVLAPVGLPGCSRWVDAQAPALWGCPVHADAQHQLQHVTGHQARAGQLLSEAVLINPVRCASCSRCPGVEGTLQSGGHALHSVLHWRLTLGRHMCATGHCRFALTAACFSPIRPCNLF